MVPYRGAGPEEEAHLAEGTSIRVRSPAESVKSSLTISQEVVRFEGSATADVGGNSYAGISHA